MARQVNESARTSNPLKRSMGGLLKARRVELKMTLQEISSRSGLSAAFLSQVERGKATPSIVSLISIAKALETDINYFIKPPAAKSLVRRGSKPEYIDIDSPVKYVRLDTDIRNQRMNALMMELPPNTQLPTVHRDEGEDFFYVLEGEVEQTIGDMVFVLRKGDCAHHNTQVDHSVRNKSKKKARLIWVGTPVIFPATEDTQVVD